MFAAMREHKKAHMQALEVCSCKHLAFVIPFYRFVEVNSCRFVEANSCRFVEVNPCRFVEANSGFKMYDVCSVGQMRTCI